MNAAFSAVMFLFDCLAVENIILFIAGLLSLRMRKLLGAKCHAGICFSEFLFLFRILNCPRFAVQILVSDALRKCTTQVKHFGIKPIQWKGR